MKNVNGCRVCKPIANSTVTDSPGESQPSTPTSGVCLVPLPPSRMRSGSRSPLTSLLPPESSATRKNGFLSAVELRFVSAAMILNTPAYSCSKPADMISSHANTTNCPDSSTAGQAKCSATGP